MNDLIANCGGFQPVLMLSGGRTSALMLRKLLDVIPDYRCRFITIFENTGKERNETLDFLHEIEVRWEVPIVWLEYDRAPATAEIALAYPHPKSQNTVFQQALREQSTHWFKVVNYSTAHRNLEPNSPFDKLLNWANVLPNIQVRMCSAQLKTRTAMRYLYSLGITEFASFIGIRKDEEDRATEILAACTSKERPQFPLIRMGVSDRDVNSYWAGSDFDLHLKQYEGNCDLCFLKALWKRVAIAREHPEFLPWWEGWEEAKKHLDTPVFRYGQPYSLVRSESQHPEFSFIKGEDVSCACMDGSFRSGDINCAL